MRSLRKVLVFLFVLGVAATSKAQAVPAAPNFGTSAVTYVQIPAEAFFPRSSSHNYFSGSGATRYSLSCAGACFAAPLLLPSGAKIVSLELDFSDVNPDGSVIGTLIVCDSTGQNCAGYPSAGGGPADCTGPGLICSGNAFEAGPGSVAVIMSADGLTVDNATKSYRLLAGGPGSATAVIAGMIVGYAFQVSPPPETATFNDVPTSHPFFQFVEALSKSGITAGCSSAPPLYCPDAPLTRGQMAVFLAKALGLQWP